MRHFEVRGWLDGVASKVGVWWEERYEMEGWYI